MLLTDSTEVPIGDGWLYETKYDGFRCLLTWEKGNHTPILESRNGHVLNTMFPEIIQFCERIYDDIQSFLPLVFDGELVYLINNFRSNFSTVQKRARMKDAQNIEFHAETFPCHYIVFDVLELKGKSKMNSSLKTRKRLLANLFETMSLPSVDYTKAQRLQVIESADNHYLVWNNVKTHNGEGIVAKKSGSKWVEGIRSKNWLKIKNWKIVNVIVTSFEQSNGFFNGAIYKDDTLIEVVTFKHGFKDEELKALIKMFKTHGALLSSNVWELPASICVAVACIDFDGTKLREPRFHLFKLDMHSSDCNWQQMQRQLNPIPEHVTVTHPDKPIFIENEYVKDDYLLYLQKIAPVMLPFIYNRLLTIIRYPHGVPGESFYQKHFPENIPPFVETHLMEDTNFALCNNLETLLWLGNQVAIELHIPFQPIHTDKPTEIVFDLDPPSVKEFSLAINAALKMKVIFEQFGLKSFVKTSGGKGMQIYIPLPVNAFSYEETGVFTEFVCKFLVEQYPESFTIERLKKNRGNKLYLDYVQHREGKTIIAPYSTRGNGKGLVATPLYWDEVNEQLSPDQFTIVNVVERINQQGNPFRDFREVGEKQDFKSVLAKLDGIDL